MTASSYAIRLAGADTDYACDADDTLLRAAQRAGLGFPYECNVGACGNCKFELIEGQLDTLWPEAPGLSAKDRERKRHLGCQSRPLSNCVVKLRPAARFQPPHRPQRVAATLSTRRHITLYFAGPPAMATAVQGMLIAAGVPPEQYHFDQFY